MTAGVVPVLSCWALCQPAQHLLESSLAPGFRLCDDTALAYVTKDFDSGFNPLDDSF